MARFSQLQDWLDWQENAHWPRIDPGLVRAGSVLQKMELTQPPFLVITVSGTNGKGSTVAMLENILVIAGYKVGSYTSPHLFRYNERIKLQGIPVTDEVICDSFDRIDKARQNTSLSYFEFGTVAAIDIFHREKIDIALLEVGLGGRLDAVNAIDPDIGIVTTVDLDHIHILGNTREEIGLEKAGIFRPNQFAICGDFDPPQSLIKRAKELNTSFYQAGEDYHYYITQQDWSWESKHMQYAHLPHPNLKGIYQYQNAASVLMALEIINDRLPTSEESISKGLESIALLGRFQQVTGAVDQIFDVSHNPQGAQLLAQSLDQYPIQGRTYAVFSMLADKDIEGTVALLKNHIHTWFLGGLMEERGLAEEALFWRINSIIDPQKIRLCSTIPMAYLQAIRHARPGDRILAFGSFHTVEEAMREAGLATDRNYIDKIQDF
ncbi:bifunctional tetrahydrofolate synthase/dihydrofolate synthase [Candidatus Nitrosacidococcus tergens]|uniref:Dihydrofolate synthase/folylpolyglutamate synthase n=1 Tax=Candidatus Nitrosacidococcus tergens TaxID=553981 RepID=A0A7G1QAS6_9GAMM|nr:bifunctional tetrahydrofolate synthase/dihydrofolate synthase [Candidatus Nitrosacidococcus tergens]CAB1276232.1 bifunctional folylpolyglutamate synthase and dihydrofolate synthase [Candidatus Nitrosacidococcus tergens]